VVPVACTVGSRYSGATTLQPSSATASNAHVIGGRTGSSVSAGLGGGGDNVTSAIVPLRGL
jgi:hypothetical protein